MVSALVFRLPPASCMAYAGIAGSVLLSLIVGCHQAGAHDVVTLPDPGMVTSVITRAPARKVDAAFLLARRASPHHRKIALRADVAAVDSIAAADHPAP